MKKTYTILTVALVFCLLSLAACDDDDNPAEPDPGQQPIEELDIPADFDFSTLRRLALNVAVNSPSNDPVEGIRINAYASQFEGGQPANLVCSGVTGQNGRFDMQFDAPAYWDRIWLQTDLVGGVNRTEVAIDGNQAAHSFGGSPVNNRGPKDGTDLPRIDLFHFPDPIITDVNMSVLIHRISGIEIVAGTELACLTPDEIVAGAEELTPDDTSWGIAVWGDDSYTEEIDGFRNGEPLNFLIWDPARQQEVECQITVLEGAQPVFSGNGFIVLSLLTEPRGKFRYSGPWNDNGIPLNLIDAHDAFNADYTKRLSLIMPESIDGSSHNDRLIPENGTVRLNRDRERLSVYFLHESSNRSNAFGYYTYPAGNPPGSVDEIEDLTIVFPNASFDEGQSGLSAGQMLFIEDFDQDFEIGFFIVVDGWRDRMVSEEAEIIFSQSSLNPEANANQKKHCLFFYDEESNDIIIGFEDDRRDQGADNDFNDMVVVIGGWGNNPPFDLEDLPVWNQGANQPDADNDNINDLIDVYPQDANRAFDFYFPSQNAVGTIAFEDDWSNVEDYDYNDLVITYRFAMAANANGAVHSFNARFGIQAAGSGKHNGFGFQMPLESGQVSDVSGSRLSAGYISLGGNGLENGQASATVIVFDDALSVVQPAGENSFVNTEPGSPLVESDPVVIEGTFTSPIPINQLGSPPFNPFIIVDSRRVVEVHPVNYRPTSLAGQDLFGQNRDRSNFETGVFYKSDANLPWALILPSNWSQVEEGEAVNAGYIHFNDWAASGGTANADWFLPIEGNMNEEIIWEVE